MATSTAVLLLPEETDDRAPPAACRIRERMSQGYRKISQSVLPVRRCLSGFEICPRSGFSRSMSQGSNFCSRREREQRRYIR